MHAPVSSEERGAHAQTGVRAVRICERSSSRLKETVELFSRQGRASHGSTILPIQTSQSERMPVWPRLSCRDLFSAPISDEWDAEANLTAACLGILPLLLSKGHVHLQPEEFVWGELEGSLCVET